jgi:hypothetical protein
VEAHNVVGDAVDREPLHESGPRHVRTTHRAGVANKRIDDGPTEGAGVGRTHSMSGSASTSSGVAPTDSIT